MLREVRGLGTLVPLDIRWIPAQTAARVDKIVNRPGPHILSPDTVILEMSDPSLQRDLLDAEYALKAAESDLANLRVQVASELMNQKATEATIRGDYEQASCSMKSITNCTRKASAPTSPRKLSKVKEDQLKIRVGLEEERTASPWTQAMPEFRPNNPVWIRPEPRTRCARASPMPCECAWYDRGAATAVRRCRADVAVGANLARVADPTKLKAEIKIAETQAKDIVYGQNATIDTLTASLRATSSASILRLLMAP